MAILDLILPFVAPVVRRLVGSAQLTRREQFEASLPAVDRVVFLGDSLTEQGLWDGWFPELQTLNRGIGGYAIGDMMSCLEPTLHDPRAISLMIGTNDLHGLGVSREVSRIADQMGLLVQSIQRRAPNAQLFINSVTPRSTHFRDRIIQLNDRYRQIAARSGSTYIDLWPVLAGPDGAIIPRLTTDGLHLSAEGYKAWTNVLRAYLAPFSTADLPSRR